ncbi:MAG: hypothetical protein QOG85_775 [Gaiellaceae bacterium]|jgi:transposase-like protein|nr:hypothetical protein [Gaiellaceae bacterium]
MERPTNLDEAIRFFADVDVATDYVAGLRWPGGWVCPHCSGREYSYLSTRRLWKCKACGKQSSVKVGTVFEGSPLGLDKWLPAIWLVANSESAISSHQLAHAIGTTHRSAWFMLQRIGEARPPGERQTPETPRGEAGDSSHLGPLALLLLGVFALGIVVGRLTKRLTR